LPQYSHLQLKYFPDRTPRSDIEGEQLLSQRTILLVLVRQTAICGAAAFLFGCSPTVRLEVPDKPIVINLNVKIEQEVRVKLERGVEEAMQNNPKIF